MDHDQICHTCNNIYKKWLPKCQPENNLCPACNDAAWAQWEINQSENLTEIERLQGGGHSHHCACRQVWGDGECECGAYKQGYDPYAWQKKGGNFES